MECVGEGWDNRSSSSTYPPHPAPMPTFEIAIGPSIFKNLHMYWTPETDRCQIQNLATSALCESITHDQKCGNWPLEWINEEHFCTWLVAKESEHAIELVVSHTAYFKSPLWGEWFILKCVCEWMGVASQ